MANKPPRYRIPKIGSDMQALMERAAAARVAHLSGGLFKPPEESHHHPDSQVRGLEHTRAVNSGARTGAGLGATRGPSGKVIGKEVTTSRASAQVRGISAAEEAHSAGMSEEEYHDTYGYKEPQAGARGGGQPQQDPQRVDDAAMSAASKELAASGNKDPSYAQLRSAADKIKAASQTGTRGGVFHIGASGTRVYEKK